MKQSVRAHYDLLLERYPALEAQGKHILSMFEIMADAYYAGGKLLVCGNGGSAADAQHIVGELMKGVALPRKLAKEEREQLASCEDAEYLCEHLQGALPSISLVGELSLMTAYANDVSAELAMAQQVYGLGRQGDALLAISTSGNSANICYAVQVAKARGMTVIGLTGASGGKMKTLCDVLLNVPDHVTYRVQELHLPVYHMLCLALENEFFA